MKLSELYQADSRSSEYSTANMRDVRMFGDKYEGFKEHVLSTYHPCQLDENIVFNVGDLAHIKGNSEGTMSIISVFYREYSGEKVPYQTFARRYYGGKGKMIDVIKPNFGKRFGTWGRECLRCGECKKYSMFHNMRNHSTGKSMYCKKCNSESCKSRKGTQ